MRDVIARFDFCSYLAVAVFLHVAARQVAHHLPRFAPGMLWSSVATLLAVGGLGYAQVRPAVGAEVIAIAVVSWICAAAAALAAAVLLPPLASLRDGWRSMTRSREPAPGPGAGRRPADPLPAAADVRA